jgi:hypothetical protein
VLQKGGRDATMFIGSFADSLHNFGFSQYFSLPYLSLDFRHYADKMKSYLYSPSFLKKVFDKTYDNDFVYNLFRGHCKSPFTETNGMDKKDLIYSYLISFMLSSPRVPFAKINQDAFTFTGEKYLKEWLYDNYFKEAVENIDCENMYYWLTRMYHLFYLKGYEKSLIDYSMRDFSSLPRQPFYDMQLVDFLQAMPENWGRGLEWLPAKYPLKRYAREVLNVPCDVIESIPHSYISEIEGSKADIRSEMINNSVLTPILQKVKTKDLSDLFDSKYFNMPFLQSVVAGDTGNSVMSMRLLVMLARMV